MTPLPLCWSVAIGLVLGMSATAWSTEPARRPVGYVDPPADSLFPGAAKVVNVRDYGARGDGAADDTAAIQRALDEHPAQGAIIYLPQGNYRITQTLRWPQGPRGGLEQKNTILQGVSPGKSVIQLIDGATDFGDAKAPKAMIWTGGKPAQRFRNAVRGLTIDCGKNAGAVALQFNASNQGCVRDVVLRGGGHIGLDLAFTDEVGPLLVSNLKVDGFDIGVLCGHAVNSQTFEHLTLVNQRQVAFRNGGQCVSIRGLVTAGQVTAFENQNIYCVTTLIDAELRRTGREGVPAAIENKGYLLARNVRTEQFETAIRSAPPRVAPQDVTGPVVSEFVSHPTLTLFGGTAKTLDLPIRETPAVPVDPADDWAVVTDYGAITGDKADDTDAIQKAIDSGKTTVCLPRGDLLINGTLHVRGSVRRIIGTEATLRGSGSIVIEDGTAPVVVIERFRITYSPITIEQKTRRTVVIANATIAAMNGSHGDLFLEDVCGGPFEFKSQNVWARQVNPEQQQTKIRNQGGKLWILGLKTERGGTLVETTAAGQSEILGGFAYATSKPKVEPMFTVNQGSQLSVTIGEACFNGNPFQILVRETRGDDSRELKRGQTPGRQIGSVIHLYSSKVTP